MTYQKRLRPYLSYLESLGFEIHDISTSGSSHYKITVTLAGNRRFFIAPYSSSDRRSFENWKSNIRKWTKEIESVRQEDHTCAGSQLFERSRRPPAPQRRERGGSAMGARG